MAFYDTADAIYGSGTYGSASYGRSTPIVQVTGVSATANTRTLHLNVFEVDVSEPIYNAQGATGSIGTLTLNTTAGLSGVAGTLNLGTLSPNVDKVIDSVSATGSVNTLTINLQEDVTGVVGTLTVDTTGLSVRSVNTVSVSGVSATGSIDSVTLSNTVTLQSAIGTTVLGTIAPNLKEPVSGFQGTTNTPSVTAKCNSKVIALGVAATGEIGDLEEKPTEEIVGVSATGSVNTVTVNIVEEPDGVSVSGRIGEVGTTAVVFDFEAVKNRYSRRRTVVLPRAA